MKGALVSLSLLLALVIPAAPALAANGGTIQGTVTNGTTKQPVPNIEVVLSRGNTETGEGEEGIQKTRTDTDGRYVFTGVADESPWMHDVFVEYEGAPYYSAGITIENSSTEKANLTVYDSTDSSKDVSVGEWLVYLDPDPAGLAVEQALAYQNTGDRSYIGPKMPGTGQRIATTLPVAATWNQDTPDTVGLFEGCCGGVVSDSFGHTAPIPPGGTQGTMRYVSSSPASLVFPATFNTAAVKVLVAPDVDVSEVSGLTPAGSETVQSGGESPVPLTYDIYTASNLQPGAAFGLTASIGGGGGDVPVALVVVLAVIGLAALLLVIARLRDPGTMEARSGAKGGPRKPATNKPQSSHKPAKPKKPSASERHSPEPLDADLLIAEIAALDLSFEKGLIGKDEYEQLRAARKAELMSRSEED